MKMPNGQIASTPWQGSFSLAQGGNDTAAGVGATAILNGAAAASATYKQLLDPWGDSPLARWPDQYTMIPTYAARDVAHFPLTIHNGGNGDAVPTSDGCAALYFRGDPCKTYKEPTSIGSSTDSTPFEMKWSGTPQYMRDSMPSGALSRPVGVGCKFTFSGVGPYHTIIARVMELPPWVWVATTDHPTGFPVAANLGPTFAQREYFRAREIVMEPGETLNFISLPANYSGLHFCWSTYERDDPGTSITCSSWGGTVVWFFGLYATDTLYCDAVMHHEFIIPGPATTPSISNATRAVVRPDVVATQAASNSLLDVVSAGWNIFKTAAGVIGSIYSLAAPFMASAIDGLPAAYGHQGVRGWADRPSLARLKDANVIPIPAQTPSFGPNAYPPMMLMDPEKFAKCTPAGLMRLVNPTALKLVHERTVPPAPSREESKEEEEFAMLHTSEPSPCPSLSSSSSSSSSRVQRRI